MYKTIWILTVFFLGALGGITTIDDLQQDAQVTLYQRFGAYTPEDSPYGGSTPAYISYHINITLEDSVNVTDNLALGEVVVVFYTMNDKIGLDSSTYCCTKKLFADGACSNLNGLIINAELDPMLNHEKLFYQNLTKSQYVDGKGDLFHKYDLSYTGIWYIYIGNCRTESSGSSFLLNGDVTWKNPYGYLPGQILGFLVFYWVLASLYSIVGAIWIGASSLYFRDMVLFQHAISLVFVVSIVEYYLWASDYTIYNKIGIASISVNLAGAFFTASKLTSIRTLMLLVAIGYKITRPILTNGYKITIGSLTFIFFLLEMVYEYLDVVSTAGFTLNTMWVNLDLILLMIANGVYFGWIGFEMFMTIKTLKESEAQKYAMYKQLGILLIVAITFSIIVLLTQLIIEARDEEDEHFKAWWIFDSYFEFIYFLCLTYVAWIWRPNEENNRYSYEKINDYANELKEKSKTNNPVDLESDDDKTSSDSSSV